MLFDIPNPLGLSEIDSALPSSEEEWYAENEDRWRILKASDTHPPTPQFQDAFSMLFQDPLDNLVNRYSEYGGYVVICSLLFSILDAHRLSKFPMVAVDFAKLDVALKNWQGIWDADPKSHISGPSSPFGAVAFNASSVYRAARVRLLRDFSKYSPEFKFLMVGLNR
jgi:hypothetical protein